jgi:hypothetical protein
MESLRSQDAALADLARENLNIGAELVTQPCPVRVERLQRASVALAGHSDHREPTPGRCAPEQGNEDPKTPGCST